MAPIEFEKHIKDQLEERKIKPSAEAWDRISGKLDVKPNRRRPIYFRYAVAALVAGIILSVVWIYRGTQLTDINRQPVVSSPVNNSAVPVIKDSPVLPSDSNATLAVQDQDKNSDSSVEDDGEIIVENTELAVEDSPSKMTDVTVAENHDLLIGIKVSEVIAQVKLLEEDKYVVTDAEVDSLLRNAQQELIVDSQFIENQQVDAAGLLAGVEDEIDKSFRDQVFEKLKQGFVKVRTAVADRNK